MQTWIEIEKRHTAEKLAYFTALSRLGVSKRKGAKLAGIGTGRMDYFLSTMGIEWRFPENGNEDTETFQRRKSMVEDGMKYEYIAEAEGITLDSLHSYCTRYGIRRRKRA